MPEVVDRKKFAPAALIIADAASDAELDNEQRILLARDLVQSVLQDVEEHTDPAEAVGEGVLHGAELLLTEALGYFS